MIMIVGVSASGKTYTIEKLINVLPGLIHIRASAILRSLGRPLQNPTIGETLKNQIFLIDYLRHKRPILGTVLLDSHAMIETSEGPLLLPDWTFDGLQPSRLIHIEEYPETIVSRRAQQGRPIADMQVIKLQALEREHARQQSERLKIPFAKVRAGDDRGLARNIR